MNNIHCFLTGKNDSIFRFFDEVYLFGSSLKTETPGDIDILLVYREDQDLWDVTGEMRHVVNTLGSKFAGATIDLTTLSKSELKDSGFLDKIPHKRIKGCKRDHPHRSRH